MSFGCRDGRFAEAPPLQPECAGSRPSACSALLWHGVQDCREAHLFLRLLRTLVRSPCRRALDFAQLLGAFRPPSMAVSLAARWRPRARACRRAEGGRYVHVVVDWVRERE